MVGRETAAVVVAFLLAATVTACEENIVNVILPADSSGTDSLRPPPEPADTLFCVWRGHHRLDCGHDRPKHSRRHGARGPGEAAALLSPPEPSLRVPDPSIAP